MVGIKDENDGTILKDTGDLYTEIATTYPSDNYTQFCNKLGVGFAQAKAIRKEHQLNLKGAVIEVLNIWENRTKGNATRAKLEDAMEKAETGALCSIVEKHFAKGAPSEGRPKRQCTLRSRSKRQRYAVDEEEESSEDAVDEEDESSEDAVDEEDESSEDEFDEEEESSEDAVDEEDESSEDAYDEEEESSEDAVDEEDESSKGAALGSRPKRQRCAPSGSRPKRQRCAPSGSRPKRQCSAPSGSRPKRQCDAVDEEEESSEDALDEEEKSSEDAVDEQEESSEDAVDEEEESSEDAFDEEDESSEGAAVRSRSKRQRYAVDEEEESSEDAVDEEEEYSEDAVDEEEESAEDAVVEEDESSEDTTKKASKRKAGKPVIGPSSPKRKRAVRQKSKPSNPKTKTPMVRQKKKQDNKKRRASAGKRESAGTPMPHNEIPKGTLSTATLVVVEKVERWKSWKTVFRMAVLMQGDEKVRDLYIDDTRPMAKLVKAASKLKVKQQVVFTRVKLGKSLNTTPHTEIMTNIAEFQFDKSIFNAYINPPVVSLQEANEASNKTRMSLEGTIRNVEYHKADVRYQITLSDGQVNVSLSLWRDKSKLKVTKFDKVRITALKKNDKDFLHSTPSTCTKAAGAKNEIGSVTAVKRAGENGYPLIVILNGKDEFTLEKRSDSVGLESKHLPFKISYCRGLNGSLKKVRSAQPAIPEPVTGDASINRGTCPDKSNKKREVFREMPTKLTTSGNNKEASPGRNEMIKGSQMGVVNKKM